ncbi:MAG TPA: TolC family protein [Polyangia bacterium]|nr:TolC family protein [Polyangia bacterium]
MRARYLILLPLLLCAALPAKAARPLSLADAIMLARQNRSDLKQAQIDLERADLNLLRAKLERIHLTIQGGASIQAQDLNTQLTGTASGANPICALTPSQCDNQSHTYGGQADLTIPIWSGFTVEADIERARWLARASQAQAKGTVRTIALDVVRAYWAVRRAELLREVEAEAVRRDQEIEEIVSRRVRAGIAPQVDLNRVHVATLREQGTLLGLDGQLGEARAQLAAVLQIDDEIVLTEDPHAHTPLVPPLEVAMDEARGARPELLAARAQVLAQAEAVRSARGGYWPQLQLFGHVDVRNANSVFTAVPTEELFSNAWAGGRALWTLFDTLSTWAQVRDAEYQRVRLEADSSRIRFQVDADVRAAHVRLSRALAQRAPLDQSEKVARDNLEIIQKRYQAGDALILDLLDAQVQLLRSQSDLVDNSVTIAQAEAELQSALGRL